MWQMLFNADMCRCLHVEHSDPSVSYYVGHTQLEIVMTEKIGYYYDLQIRFSFSLLLVVSAGNEALNVIIRTYVYRSQSNMYFISHQ